VFAQILKIDSKEVKVDDEIDKQAINTFEKMLESEDVSGDEKKYFSEKIMEILQMRREKGFERKQFRFDIARLTSGIALVAIIGLCAALGIKVNSSLD